MTPRNPETHMRKLQIIEHTSLDGVIQVSGEDLTVRPRKRRGPEATCGAPTEPGHTRRQREEDQTLNNLRFYVITGASGPASQPS